MEKQNAIEYLIDCKEVLYNTRMSYKNSCVKVAILGIEQQIDKVIAMIEEEE